MCRVSVNFGKEPFVFDLTVIVSYLLSNPLSSFHSILNAMPLTFHTTYIKLEYVNVANKF